MAADLSEQAVQMEIKGGKLTVQVVVAAVRRLLRSHNTVTHGVQSLHKLNLQGRQLETVPIGQADLAAIRKELRKYSVDYSVMRDRETGNYTVFFKAQDTDRVYKGLENFALDWNSRRKPMREVMQDAQRTAEERNRKQPEKTQERTAERSKDSR